MYENSLHTDEVYRIYWAKRTYTDILKMSKKEVNPPFYLWILHTWIKLNGDYTNEVHARYLSLIFSVLTSVFIFLYGKSYFNYGTGVIASLFFSFNPIQVLYAHNISAYTMITFLFVVSLYITHLFFRYFDILKFRWLLFSLLVFIDTILVYTHYFIIFGLMAQLIMAIFEYTKHKKAFIHYIFTQIISLILFLPWLKFMLKNAKADVWMKKPTWESIKEVYQLFIGSPFLLNLFLSIVIILIIFNALQRQNQWKKMIILLIISILPVAGISIISLVFEPFFVSRYMLYLIPGALLLLAYQLSILKKIWIKITLFCVFCYFFIVNLNLNPIVDTQLRQVIPVIAEEVKEPGTLLVINAGYMKYLYTYYFNQYNSCLKSNSIIIHEIEKLKGVFIEKPSDIEKIYSIPDWNKIVYIQLHSEIIDPDNTVLHWLNQAFLLNKRIASKAVVMSVYTPYPNLWPSTEHRIFFTSFDNHLETYKNITTKKPKSGLYSAYSHHKQLRYSEAIRGKAGAIYGKKGKIKISAWIYLEPFTKGNFTISLIAPTGKQYFWQKADIDYSQYEKWQYVSMQIPISEIKNSQDELRCYFEAYEGATAYIDDITLEALLEP